MPRALLSTPKGATSMSFSARYMFAVLFVVLSLTVTVFAQSTTGQTNKAPRGTVSGRVTIKDKGAPGVAVGLRRTEPSVLNQSFLRATTDHDGFYRITNVPPGSYEVTPSVPAFVPADNNRAQTVVVGEDENVEGINFALVRGGVITGKVTDADGRPVIQQQVSIFRVEAFTQRPGTQRPIFPGGGAQTDDRGIYRMYGLTAGRYKVATGRSDEMFTPNFSPNRTSYQQVFHPDTTDHTKATIIEIAEGTQANDVDIKLGPAMQTFSVTGRVINSETGLPIPNIRFGLQRMAGQRPEFMNTTLVTSTQGDFFAEGLMPGKYMVFMFTTPNDDLRAESLNFEIIDQDVTDLVIKMMKGATLSGVVVLESNDKTAFQKLSQMQLHAHVTAAPGTSGFGRTAVSSIAADGSFRLAGLPAGTANIALSMMMGPDLRGFSLSRVERDGVITTRTVEIKDGEHIAGLRVFVSYGNATLRGVVKVENGPPTGGRIFVRLTKPGDTSPQGFRPPPVDARGHFLMEGVPPGTYELHVQVSGAGGPRSVKREVVLQDGVVTDVTITIDASTPPKP